jgi:hypothetical protein
VPDLIDIKQHRAAGPQCGGDRAFSSEVDTGSRKENASKQKTRASVDLIRTEKALACGEMT